MRNSGNPGKPEPEFSGSSFFKLISGSIFGNPKYPKPELPDPKFSGNPNAQPYSRGSGWMISQLQLRLATDRESCLLGATQIYVL